MCVDPHGSSAHVQVLFSLKCAEGPVKLVTSHRHVQISAIRPAFR